MTFPNRSNVAPGQQQASADDSAAATTMPALVPTKPLVRRRTAAATTEGLQQELTFTLAALSPAPVASQSMPPTEVCVKQVSHTRKRLLEEDSAFQGSEHYQILLCSSTKQDQLSIVDEYLHEWSKRRMLTKQQRQQHEPQPTSTGGANFLPSLSQPSPYATELAARNLLPKKRSSLSSKSKKLMQEWFEHNLHHPYPTEEEKEWLAREGGIALEQVNNWFINTRGRKWKPMLHRLMAKKQAGGTCSLYDKMVQKMEEPYHRKL
ncbi:hypothetical protein PHYPSEUDO_000594 [Phytophthora pseudosyringae]|uniref:Homeobox domain-containing protein n=1 Tax=Phytophthora pseudosyringae TaxID=221518 RepID=A0A8T1VXJ2_9STRA|nr:hypothetical protein PHYPSEUDO_000594 [Phytophthora pseudosyringae]